jgi:hypothetical protein
VYRLTRLHTSTIAVLNLFLTVGLLGIYLKFALLNQQWDAVARFLGKIHSRELGMLERLGFFHGDILLNLLVIPAAATCLTSLLFRSYRVAAGFAVSAALSVGYFIELRAQIEVGQYISREVLRDLLGWAAMNPGMGGDYVTWASVIKLTCLLALLAAIAFIAKLARRADERQTWRAARRYRLLLAVPAVVALVGGAGLAAASYVVRTPGLLLNGSSIGRVVTALTTPGDPEALKAVSFDQALELSRLRAATPPFDAGHPLVGRAAGADLLIFMMETGPARALDLSAVGRDLPGAGALYGRALVATRHYTTHPYSSDAMYSILSGLYPQGRRRLLRDSAGSQVNALMTALQADVPVRGVYVPSLYDIELDDRMYAVFGAQSVYAADAEVADPLRAEAERRAEALIVDLEQTGSRFEDGVRRHLWQRLALDIQALERVKADITAAIRAGARYAVMFFPEIGHAPWFALHGEDTVMGRGRALMRLQDAWLRELFETVERSGRLERTVIAVTADHGLRTRAEDPALTIGRLSDDTFRVPLLIYAPQALQQPIRIENPTSHIDFAPTLLAFLGKAAAAARMQGVPLWQRRAEDRLYFFGSSYGGAEGFVQDGTYYMRQALSGAVYRHDRFAFGDETQVESGSPIVGFVSGALAEAAQLQQALVTRVMLERTSRPDAGSRE